MIQWGSAMKEDLMEKNLTVTNKGSVPNYQHFKKAVSSVWKEALFNPSSSEKLLKGVQINCFSHFR